MYLKVWLSRLDIYPLADKRQGGELYEHLRCQWNRLNRFGSDNPRGQIANRRSIPLSSKAVNAVAIVGPIVSPASIITKRFFLSLSENRS
jgi:hypothetical protein